MADIVDATTRSRMMSGIRSKNTKAELEIRKNLFVSGFRYRLHDNRLPGKPDLTFPHYRAVIFIHGCFWHAHSCHLFKIPDTRSDFWKTKLKRNRRKDEETTEALRKLGWRILTVWECSFRGKGKKRGMEINRISVRIAKWLRSNSKQLEIRG
ncbi:MAG: DNA mismatch endonuclease Vsr [Nitrospiraceae bacterium]|nr:MAG: DNA mismatch endonuclease Vsr [Nitrospiraceae bacterium]